MKKISTFFNASIAGVLGAACLILASGCIDTGDTSPEYLGGLVWDNYTKTGAGGNGTVPTTNKDFVRCKACHGWDGLGLDGGYVRRSATATRPNPTAGIGNLAAIRGSVVAADVEHSGGRAFTTEDQTMPDYTAAGGLTAAQLSDAVAFLNSGPRITDHATLDINDNPVSYHFFGVDSIAGAALYAASCAACHGANGKDDILSGVKLGEYFSADGKYSEGFHKMVYGVADTLMTRSATGNLTGQGAADILAYIQTEIAAGNF